MITRLLISLGVFVGFFVLVSAISIWQKRTTIPKARERGIEKRTLISQVMEITKFAFFEDTTTFAKTSKNPRVKYLASMRFLHVLVVLVGVLGFTFSSSPIFFVVFILSFFVGMGMALRVLPRRRAMKERLFKIVQDGGIKYPKATGRNATPVNPDNWMTITKWDGDKPEEIALRFPAGSGPIREGQVSFEKKFDAAVTNENEWDYEWDLPHDLVTIKAVPNLPEKLSYPGSADSPWNIFPVGLSKYGPASYNVSINPHVLVGGPSGTGKSVLQRNMVFHCIQHSDEWRFMGIDIKQVELEPYKKYSKTVESIALTYEEGTELLRYANNLMMDRYANMREAGYNNIMDMPNHPPAYLIMIDEATMFLGRSGSKTEEGKAEDMLKAEASDLVGKILRLGRAAGIHMVIAMQRPDAEVLKGEFKANMEVRIAAGRMDSTPSSMILDSGEAAWLPPIKGRGLLRVGGQATIFQGYFAPQDWIDDFILEHPETEPSCVAPGGHLHEKFKEKLKAEGRPFPDNLLTQAPPSEMEPTSVAGIDLNKPFDDPADGGEGDLLPIEQLLKDASGLDEMPEPDVDAKTPNSELAKTATDPTPVPTSAPQKTIKKPLPFSRPKNPFQ